MKKLVFGMKKLLFVLFFIIGCSVSKPKEYKPVEFKTLTNSCIGEDFLALARMDTKTLQKSLTYPVCIGALQGTFGDVRSKLKFLLDRNLVLSYRIHLADGTCIRNHSCSSGSVQYSDYKTLENRAKQFEQIHAQYPLVPCYVSPFLEYDSKNISQVNRWFQIIHNFAPSCIPVVSAFTGYKPPGILVESHGQNARGAVISHDGFDGFQTVNINSWFDRGKTLSLFWTNRWNLRFNGEHSNPPPPLKRIAFPTSDQIIHSVRLFNNPEPQPKAPAVCKKVLQIKSPELSKVRSEDFGPNTTDKRSDKPALIVKLKTSQFAIYSPAGVKIGCAKFYPGTYNGMNRYYEGNCSGLTAVGLMDKAKSEWSFWKTSNTCYAYNNIRRLGATQK